MAERLFIGVDGGGSGCRVSIRDRTGAEIGAARGGPANATTDAALTLANVSAALKDAMNAAGLGAADLRSSSAHLGLAGLVGPEVLAQVSTGLETALDVSRCSYSDDREIQVLGALGGRDGFVAAIGTGTILARMRDGIVTGVGGWGFVLSDQGSGADLGRRALSHTLLSLDGMADPSPLTRDLATRFGGAPGIAAFAARATPAEFAALAPDIVAASGDAVADSVLSDGAVWIDRGLRALGIGPGDTLCVTGGLGSAYRERLAKGRAARMVAARGTALDGAISMAGGPVKWQT